MRGTPVHIKRQTRLQAKVQTRYFPLILLAIVSAAGIARAQDTAPITLRSAVEMALQKNPDRKVAAAETAAAKVGAQSARLPLLPTVGFDELITRGNDPVYVFGSLLRQQNFSQADFSLNSLNRPLPLNNFATRFSGQWQAFDSFHTQLEMRRADQQFKSAVAIANRADQQIAYRVVGSYEAILLARQQVEVATHQVETAQSLLDSSKSRVKAGTAVDADQLSAATNLAARQQELIAAQGNLAIAWAQLEQAVGAPIPDQQRQLKPIEQRNFDVAPLNSAVALALKSRSDKEAIAQQLAAEKTGVASAKAAFGPTIGTFGSWEMDRDSFAGSGGNNWLAGAQIHLDLLPAARRQQLAAAKISLERAQAMSLSADSQIRLEVTRAWYAHRAAAQQLVVAQAAVAQAAESQRIFTDRYDAGLATMTDLLRVEDAQRQAQNGYWQSVYANTLTYVDLQFAIGTLNPIAQEDLQ